MKGYFFKLLITLFSISNNVQAQVNDRVVLNKAEMNIVAPRYKTGYQSFCKEIVSLYKSEKVALHKNSGYFSSFELTIDKDGKMASCKYLKGTKNMFAQVKDTLRTWLRNLPRWTPAYNSGNKGKVDNYKITVDVFLSNENNKIGISVLLMGRRSRTLFKYATSYS